MNVTIVRDNYNQYTILDDQFQTVFIGHERLRGQLDLDDSMEVDCDNIVTKDDQICLYSNDDHPHGRCEGCGTEHWVVHLGPCPRCGLEDGGRNTGDIEQEAKDNDSIYLSPNLDRLQPLIAANVLTHVGRDEFRYVPDSQ